MPPERSTLWKAFVKVKKSSGACAAKCKLCHCEIKTSGNTTNLKRHLERRHHGYLKKINIDKNEDTANRKTMSGATQSEQPSTSQVYIKMFLSFFL